MSDSSFPAQEKLDQGLRRQLEVLGERKPAGWKVGLTSGGARDSMGPGFRPFGFILPERVFPSGARIERAGIRTPGVENEFCFTIGQRLGAGARRDDAIKAVESVCAAFELNERRLQPGATTADRLADDLSQWGIVVGEARVLDWRAYPFTDVAVRLSLDGSELECVAAAGHIDDHFDSLAALARQLARFGRALEPGHRVITGSFGKHAVTDACRLDGDFDAGAAKGIGQVSVEFL